MDTAANIVQGKRNNNLNCGSGHVDLAPHRFDYTVADSGRKGKIINHCNSISLMGMQAELSVPGGLAHLAPHHFLVGLVSGSRKYSARGDFVQGLILVRHLLGNHPGRRRCT
ncbi:unnamed protein product [Polarella glacialis]|uniref:Uncharacterized protein n=1 Tax=Polarella glacialis TaxID=89957 RepID=A0A813EWZ4_POLGL|nr:unnamed protein product [Polarella glacialis]